MRFLLPCLAVLAVVAGPLVGQQVPEGPEPNATIATATPLPAGAEATGHLASPTDADWFAFNLTVAADVRLETAPGAGAEIGDTVLTLLDATGSPLRADDDGVRTGFYSRLDANGLPAGSYFIVVERGVQAAASGSYVLDLRVSAPVSLPAPAVIAEGPENNDPRSGGTPTTISLPARCNGQLASIGAGGDWDFYRFLLTADAMVQVRLAATASHPQPPVADDPVLYLFDGSTPPNQIAGPIHASNFGTFDHAFDVRLAAGVWQVAVRGWLGSTVGRYYLDVHRADAAVASVFAGGCGGRQLDVATTNVGAGAPQRLERPVVGSTWALRGSSLGAGGVTFHAVGFASQNLDLTPFGAPGCTLEVVVVDSPLSIADASGQTTFVLALPEQPSLIGLALESQLAVLDFSNPLGLTLSNRVRAVVGN
jgi:hypothetical protein